MSNPDCILVMLPLADEADPHAWLLADRRLQRDGHWSQLRGELDEGALEESAAIALVPASASTYRLSEARGLEPKQEVAVARIDAAQEAMGNVRAATMIAGDGRVAVATVDSNLLEAGLRRLELLGLTVNAAVPAAALITPESGEVLRVQLGDESFLRSAQLACPDEPELSAALFGNAQPKTFDGKRLSGAIAELATSPQPDFLEGVSRRRARAPIFSETHLLWLKRLAVVAASLLVVSVATYWGKLEWEASQENERALAAAQRIDPSIADIDAAEAAIDRAFARSGRGQAGGSMLAAIVWQSLQAGENVGINDLRVGQDGTLAATLSGTDSNNINKVLLAIQAAGYRITATPRRDQSGTTLVDLTVRAQ